MITTRLDFMRHGQPVGGQLYRGNSIDNPLSELGWQQMKANSQHFMDWDYIITSPLTRCLEFTQYLADELAIDYDVVDDLKEVGFGDWEGKTREWLKQHRLAEYQAFYQNPVKYRPQGAETLENFSDRVYQSIDYIVQQHKGKKCLIVAHAGVIRASLGWCIEAPIQSWYRAQVSPASISRYSYEHKTKLSKLEFFNYYHEVL